MKKQLFVWSVLTLSSAASIVPNATHISQAQIIAAYPKQIGLPLDDFDDDDEKEESRTEGHDRAASHRRL